MYSRGEADGQGSGGGEHDDEASGAEDEVFQDANDGDDHATRRRTVAKEEGPA